MKNKNIIFYIIFFMFMFMFGCRQNGLQHNIKIKNSTSSTIIITSCDMTTSTSFPVEIEASKETEIVVEGSKESATFYLNVKDKNFMLNTGYIQDDGFVNIEISEDNSNLTAMKNSEIEAILVELD